MRREILAALVITPLLAGCGGSGGGKVQSASSPATRPGKIAKPPVRQPVKGPLVRAEVHMAPGLEGVIGATAADLTRRFGAPRLDVLEGDARKLQFSAAPCILDVYLYPAVQGREPQATYVDARRASDGKDVDRASCVAALGKR